MRGIGHEPAHLGLGGPERLDVAFALAERIVEPVQHRVDRRGQPTDLGIRSGPRHTNAIELRTGDLRSRLLHSRERRQAEPHQPCTPEPDGGQRSERPQPEHPQKLVAGVLHPAERLADDQQTAVLLVRDPDPQLLAPAGPDTGEEGAVIALPAPAGFDPQRGQHDRIRARPHERHLGDLVARRIAHLDVAGRRDRSDGVLDLTPGLRGGPLDGRVGPFEFLVDLFELGTA